MENKQVQDLLYQALETELGGVEIYRMAILCARNEELKEEWTKYGEQTERQKEKQGRAAEPHAAVIGRRRGALESSGARAADETAAPRPPPRPPGPRR